MRRSVLMLAAILGCVSPPLATNVAGPAPASKLSADQVRWASKLRHPLLEPVVIDPQDGFDPDEIALLAVASSPGLRTLRRGRGVAEAQVISAGLLPNPALSFQTYSPVAGQTTGNVTGLSGQLTWSLRELVTRGPTLEAARLAEESVLLDIAWSEWTVAMQAQLLAYQSILLHQARKIHLANIEELEDALGHVRHAALAGTITTAELTNIESVLLQARTANAATNREIALRSAELRGVLGGIEGVVNNIVGELQPPDGVERLSPDALTKDLPLRRPDLKALRISRRSQDAALIAAARQAFPAIQLGLQVARDAGDYLAIGPTIQIALPVANHGQAGRAAARAEAMRLSDLYAERLNLARQQISMALADIQGSIETLSYLEEAILRQRRVVDLYAAARSQGATDIIVYYTARTTLVQLRLQKIIERSRLWQGLVRLRAESGLYRLTAAPARPEGDQDAS